MYVRIRTSAAKVGCLAGPYKEAEVGLRMVPYAQHFSASVSQDCQFLTFRLCSPTSGSSGIRSTG